MNRFLISMVFLAHMLIATVEASEIKDFFLPEKVKLVQLNPKGDKALVKIHHDNNYLLMVLDLTTMQKQIVFYQPTKLFGHADVVDNIRQSVWVNDTTLFIVEKSPYEDQTSQLVKITTNADGTMSHQLEPIKSAYKRFLFPSIYEKGSAFVSYYNRKGGVNIERFDVKEHEYSDPLNDDLKIARRWLFDAKENLRVGWGIVEDQLHVWHRKDNDDDWDVVLKWPAGSKDTFIPAAIAEDGKKILFYTNVGRDFLALQEFDPETKKAGDIIFEHNNSEIQRVRKVRGSEAIHSVEYLRDGLNQIHYFDAKSATLSKQVSSLFPEQQARIVSANKTGSKVIVLTHNHENRGKYYLWDITKNQLMLLGSKDPKLADNADKSEITVLNVLGKDDFNIQAYLTVPKGKKNPPLIVMPHGGPIGVQDNLYFDRHSQLIVSRGYATLKVNYRGSSGFGKKFMFAGRKQWGLNIEDDIARVVDNVIDKGLVDAQRVCIFGASYGGYSALMSTIRYPEKYKCAISFAGVTDIPLMFAEDTRMKSDDYKKTMIDIVGDPIKDAEYQRNNSPVYRYKDLKTPIMLAHGDKDPVVTSEHSDRLSLMLNTAGTEHIYLQQNGASHSLAYTHFAEQFYTTFFSFLETHIPEPEQP
jgi:dipeptidyl aminopeptidase/acylaminoacyl peptidase